MAQEIVQVSVVEPNKGLRTDRDHQIMVIYHISNGRQCLRKKGRMLLRSVRQVETVFDLNRQMPLDI
jgi:hypothetical protein